MSFQSFALRHLVIKPIRNTQKLPNFQICFLKTLIIHEENSPRSWRDYYMRGVSQPHSRSPLAISDVTSPVKVYRLVPTFFHSLRTGLGTRLAGNAFRWRDLAVPPPAKINSNRKDRKTTKNSKSRARNR